jgi:mannose-6-phosphate isomerase-like protein (cupin superfamily)
LTDDERAMYLRKVDFGELEKAAGTRFSQRLLDHTNGARTCMVSYIQTPAGSGSPEGMHTHEVDQVFYLLSGTMNLEIAGEEMKAESGSLVVFPAGVPHRNWNAGSVPTVHLAINAPLPDPSKPLATRA